VNELRILHGSDSFNESALLCRSMAANKTP
jgi:hypothetical protein